MQTVPEKSLKTQHDRPCQRQHPRILTSLKTQVEEQMLWVTDWSIGGLRIQDPPKSFITGAVFTAQLEIPLPNNRTRFCSRVGIVRTDITRKEAGLAFLDLTEEQSTWLQQLGEQSNGIRKPDTRPKESAAKAGYQWRTKYALSIGCLLLLTLLAGFAIYRTGLLS